jgi:hypothetical protein
MLDPAEHPALAALLTQRTSIPANGTLVLGATR